LESLESPLSVEANVDDKSPEIILPPKGGGGVQKEEGEKRKQRNIDNANKS
jgi:hypothetical protein